MSEDQAMLFQVIGAIGCVCFLSFMAIRDRWPSLLAAVARLRVHAAAILPLPAARSEASPASQVSQVSNATRLLLQDGRRWLIVGAPGSGKSTAARQMVRSYLSIGADVLICDPEGAAWPAGAQLVGSPDDYEAIGRALADVLQLAQARRAAFQRGMRSFDPLLVVIDESPMVLRSAPGAIDIIADLARRGRKLAISVILLATDTQAKTLGLEGQTKLLDSFIRLDARMTSSGVELLEDGIVLSTARLDHGSDDLVLPEISETNADRLLASALGVSQPLTTGVAGVATPDCEEMSDCSQQQQRTSEGPERPSPAVVVNLDGIDWASIAKLVQAGAVGETAALKALGYTPGSTNARYQAARAALHQALGKS